MGKLKVGLKVRFRPVAVIHRIEYLEPISQFPMSAFAYKLSFRATQIADSDRQKAAKSGDLTRPHF